MILAASAVTIYFVGLINFYEPSGMKGREVIIPRAEGHRLDVTIEGLTRGKTDCDALAGTWDDRALVCKVTGVSGKKIQLPPSATSFHAETGFENIPDLSALCSTLSTVRSGMLSDATKSAARLSITSGKLDACTNVDEWISFLSTDAGPLVIGSKSVALGANAIVWISNAPLAGGAASSSIAHDASDLHFLQYYQLYDGAATCSAIPTKTVHNKCPDSFANIDGGTSGGIGCSNSGCCSRTP